MNKIIVVVFFVLLNTQELIAGPGGKIARELFESPAGKLFGIILFIVLFPLIAWSWYKRSKVVRSTKNKIAQLSKIDHKKFDEINLKNRITDVFTRVHTAWSERDLDNCEDYMTHWYLQNQQSVFLDQWDAKGLMNVCTIQEIKSIKPIHVRVTEAEDFDGSRIMYAINATMEDYLVNTEDSSIIEGKKGFKEVETVWTLQLDQGAWKVDNIEQFEAISMYLKMESEVSDSIIEKLMQSKNLA